MARVIELTIRMHLKPDAAGLDEIGRRELRAYVADAVETWGGQFPPDDPLFYPFKKVTSGAARELSK